MHKTIIGVLLITVLLVPGACAPAPAPSPSPGGVIEDLAYINVFVSDYSDNNDLQTDGIAINISFYNSNSQPITFEDIAVTATIELYGYSGIFDAFDHDRMKLVYQQQVTVDHSMTLSEYDEYIRLPFENITVDRSRYYEFGTIKVIMATPRQGDFSDMQDMIRLYAEN
jgi:hypothetical protein